MNRDYTTKSQTFGMLVTAGLIGTAVGFTMAKRTSSMLLLRYVTQKPGNDDKRTEKLGTSCYYHDQPKNRMSVIISEILKFAKNVSPNLYPAVQELPFDKIKLHPLPFFRSLGPEKGQIRSKLERLLLYAPYTHGIVKWM
jgi:hypothetical protein